MRDFQQFGFNIGTTVIRRFATFPLGLATLFILARSLDPTGLGHYNLALFVPTLLSTLFSLGIAPANVYYIGQNRDRLNAALPATLIWWLLLSAVGMVVAALALAAFSSVLFPNVPSVFLYAALFTYPVVLLYTFLTSLLQGLQDFSHFNLIALVVPFVTLILLICTVVFSLGVIGALAAYGAGQWVGALLAWRILQRQVSLLEKRQAVFEYMRDAVRYGWKANLTNVIVFLNYRIDVYLINLILNPTAVGLYFAAVRLVELLWIPSTAASMVLMPRIAELHNDEAQRLQITPLVARATVFLTGLLALGMLLVGYPLFALMGSSYAASYPVLLVLMPGAILITLSRVLAHDLAARGRVDLNVYTSMITFVLEVSFITALAVRFQLNGVAAASSIAYGLQAGVSLYFYVKVTGYQWWRVLLPTALDVRMLREMRIVFQQRVLRRFKKAG